MFLSLKKLSWQLGLAMILYLHIKPMLDDMYLTGPSLGILKHGWVDWSIPCSITISDTRFYHLIVYKSKTYPKSLADSTHNFEKCGCWSTRSTHTKDGLVFLVALKIFYDPSNIYVTYIAILVSQCDSQVCIFSLSLCVKLFISFHYLVLGSFILYFDTFRIELFVGQLWCGPSRQL